MKKKRTVNYEEHSDEVIHCLFFYLVRHVVPQPNEENGQTEERSDEGLDMQPAIAGEPLRSKGLEAIVGWLGICETKVRGSSPVRGMAR